MNLIDRDKLIEEAAGLIPYFIDASNAQYVDGLTTYHELVNLQPTVNDWIPVSEKLPEEYDWVLAAWEEHSTGFRGVPMIAELRRNGCWGFQEELPREYLDDLDIIAWMSIPEYEGGKE